MNHVAAVAAPLVGGGYEVIFYAGSILALISLGVAQWVKVCEPTQAAVEK